jgi:hypothetical protein
VAETEFVRAMSRTTKQEQDVPAHWLDLAAAGVEPFNDFEPAGSTVTAPAASTPKEK